MRIFKIIDGNFDVYYLDEEEILTAYKEFGRLREVIQYDLANPLDITDQINGDYFDE